MTDWDSPNRSRAFLAAAAFVAATGAFVSWTSPAYQIARLEAAHAGRPLVNITESAIASNRPIGDNASPNVAEGVALPGEDLKDAIAAPGASPLLVGGGRAGVFPGGASSARVAPHGPNQAAAAAKRMTAGDSAALFAEALQAASGGAAAPQQPQPAEDAQRAKLAENRRLLLEWVAQDQDPEHGTPQWLARRERARRRGAELAAARENSALLTGGARSAARSGEREPADALERERAARRKTIRVKKPSLSKLLGRVLRPPKGKIAAPKAKPWARPRPAFGPDGKPVETAAWPLEKLDELDAPAIPCKRANAHWHSEASGAWMHDKAAWGRLSGRSWAWVQKEGGRWWAWTSPEAKPVLWHQKRWWLSAQGYWFLMHDGQPWGYWFLDRWGQEGFENVAGQQIFYSADEKKVAVVTPGRGAELYDAATGAFLGSWGEDELPRRLRPKAPDALPAPR